MDANPDTDTDAEVIQRIETLIDLRDALCTARLPPEPRRLVPSRAEAMEAQAWLAVIDAAKDLVAFADRHCVGLAPPLDRVLH